MDRRLIPTVSGILALLTLACITLVVWQADRSLEKLRADLTTKGEPLSRTQAITNPPAHLPIGMKTNSPSFGRP